MPFKGKIKSITTDNGMEFAAHEIISKSLGVPVYFADPYSSWQKGAIENANGLVRQYIPKSAAFSNFSQQKITKFMAKINGRPRKKLNSSTTKECFYKKHYVFLHLLVEFALKKAYDWLVKYAEYNRMEFSHWMRGFVPYPRLG